MFPDLSYYFGEYNVIVTDRNDDKKTTNKIWQTRNVGLIVREQMCSCFHNNIIEPPYAILLSSVAGIPPELALCSPEKMIIKCSVIY